ASPPTHLTDLGRHEVFMAGTYYRNRYLSNDTDDSNSTRLIALDEKIYSAQELSAFAPADAVLQNSATGFLQGLYPPAGRAATAELRNGSTVESPLDGYQLIAVQAVDNGGNSENNAWLQSTSNCPNAEVSSNNYFSSDEYAATKKASDDFYKSLQPMLAGAFTDEQMSYKNAYTIFDYVNVARIHNDSSHFAHDELLTNATFGRLGDLANVHEFNLAYNESDPIRAVAGSILAGQMLKALNETVESEGKKAPLNIQFGAYATFLSFFGLTGLAQDNEMFKGVPDYASSMAVELVSKAGNASSFPDTKDIFVRFTFANGTIDGYEKDTLPQTYPIFGKSESDLSWSDFVDGMEKISITGKADWCKKCGSSAASCSADGDNSASASSTDGSHGMSKAVAGVVGAMVTLGVILGLEALFLLFSGFRLTRGGSAAAAAAAAAAAKPHEVVSEVKV
ncbi:hypothetical protein KEM56_004318, partial [Ascosphaera pollenicola]